VHMYVPARRALLVLLLAGIRRHVACRWLLHVHGSARASQ
jgi:hypothetical protein